MKIPEHEMQALFDWSSAELKKIEEDYPYVPGVLDGGDVVAQKAHFKEYNERLAALKRQYENKAIAKVRTFNHVLQNTVTG